VIWSLQEYIFTLAVCKVNYFLPDGLWNARSIRNKTTALCDFVVSNQLDIMVLTERWLKGDDSDV